MKKEIWSSETDREGFGEMNLDEALRSRILPLRMMIFDVDGVMTDGRIVYHDDGSELKVFDVQDGHGIKLLQRGGIEAALITGRSCRAVDQPTRRSVRRPGWAITRWGSWVTT